MNGELPIDAVLPEICAQLAGHPCLVLQAPPGAGKTTHVPLALLEQPWLAGRSILMLEPRRLAARAAAARMAELLGEPTGRSVGYRVRFDVQVSAATRIEVLTEGILTRRLQSDPELQGVGLVIFDEFHERSLHADLALALCRESQQALRDDLKILVMSATLDGAAVAGLLGDAPIVSSAGRAFPVTVHYQARESSAPLPTQVAHAVVEALARHDGDVLAFLPGGGEIRRAQELLAQRLDDAVQVLPLYGDLPQEAQNRAIRPDAAGRRKVVLATPIAETSLTIEGVRVVVDSGYARVPRFDPRRSLSRLETVRISQDSAEQRAGRAGRLGPGVCYRLWPQSLRLAPRRSPEILEADLAPLALELAQWGVQDANALIWLDPPPAAALAQARELLTRLEALDERGRITEQGRRLAALPLHPRLAHMLLEGRARGLGALACDLAALLEERDLLGRDSGVDLELRLEALAAYRSGGREAARKLGADPNGCARVEQAARQYRQLLGEPRPVSAWQRGQPGLLLALAYPDRVAQRRDGESLHYRLANGRGARLAEHDPLAGRDWLAVAQLDAGQDEGRVFLAVELSLAELEDALAARLEERERVAWDARQQAVTAVRERCLDALVL
ncbi:MAG TPA: ATP-dependent helicase HrpB, partial [Candidatus Competibacteraceae bacterium]|nr:ATP-dependent helicase HrpB [Candidatus Competibacteraceae bacterium]